MDEFAINFIFIALWCSSAYLYLCRRKLLHSIQKKIFHFTLLLVLIAELVTNGYLCMKHLGATPLSEDEFNQWYNPLSQLSETIQASDPDLYRISIFNDRNQCSSCLFGYAGFNTFSSSDNYSLRCALHGLGIATSNRSILENGYTDLTYMLFSGKYRIHLPAEDDPLSPPEAYYEQLPYALPIGYMVSSDIYQYEATDNPFESQEALLKAMTGHDYHFFEPIALKDLTLLSANATFQDTEQYKIFSRRTELGGTGYVTFSAPLNDNKDYYACFTVDQASADAYSALIVGAASGFHETPALSYGAIAKGSEFYGSEKNGNLNISVFLPEETADYFCRDMFFVYYDNSELPNAYEDLSTGNWNILSMFSDQIQATVTATEDRSVLFTSIPYEEGWEAQVDGKSYPLNSTMNEAFLSLDLTPGNHTILLSYTAPGQKAGTLISISSACILGIIAIIRIFFNKKAAK